MIKVYVNYPEAHFTIHSNPNCSEVRKHKKQGQRILDIDENSLGTVLCEFVNRKHSFGSDESKNDMWLYITLSNPEQERGVVNVVKIIVGKRYTRLGEAPVMDHC